MAGVNGLPAAVVAVTGNLTMVAPRAGGYVSLTSVPTATPGTSTINDPAGDIRANGVFAPLSPDGTLSLTASTNVHVVFDVTGYFTATGATWVPIGPVRDLDTRLAGFGGAFHSSVPRTLKVAGANGIPANATAVTGNITVTAQTSAGYVAVTKTPIATPSTSTLNFPIGDNRPNNFTSPLAADGSLGIVMVGASAASTADVIVDITGYFVNDSSGALYFPVTPERAADSRSSNGLNGPIPTNASVTLGIVGTLADIPSTARAITGNLTVTAPAGRGYVAITPYAVFQPSTSTLNFPANDTRANGFVSALGAGSIGLSYIAPGNGHIVVDVTGYFAGGSFPDAAAPAFAGMSLYRYAAWTRQATQTWCAGAATQAMLNLVRGEADHSSSNQGAYVAYGSTHSKYVPTAGTEGDGWANAATYYGAGSYTLGSYSTFDEAMKAAATRMRITGKPVGLVVKAGRHAWVLAGFTSIGADPATSQDFILVTATIMAPNYGSGSSDPAPGSVVPMSDMANKLTGYTDDYPTIWDDTFVIVQP